MNAALPAPPAVLPTRSARLPDWQLRFADLVHERMSAPFVWGRHDCCLWAADVVLALTGLDPAAALRCQYSNERGALRLVSQLGGLPQIASAALGEPRKASYATVGDVLLITHTGRTTLAKPDASL